MVNELVVEIAGWAGAAVLLAAYAYVSIRPAAARRLSYHLMNLAGAAGLSVNAVWHGALPAVGLNLVWASIGLLTMVRLLRDRSA